MESEQAIRVFVVDDHPVVRAGLKALINSEADMHVAGEAENAQEALKTDIDKAEPDDAVEKDAEETRQPLAWKVRRGYAYLAQAEFLNAGATAADNQLEELETQRLQKHLNAKFGEILGATLPPEVRFKRMVATDSTVLKRFVKELLKLLHVVGGVHFAKQQALVAARLGQSSSGVLWWPLTGSLCWRFLRWLGHQRSAALRCGCARD